MWRARRDPFGSELVEETEAFLEGRLVERLVEIGAPVPNWAWTNLLAHGDEALLREPPILGSPGGRLWVWSQGRAFMAREVLDGARAHPSLQLFQQLVVIPLELDLASADSLGELRTTSWISVVMGRVAPDPRRTNDP